MNIALLSNDEALGKKLKSILKSFDERILLDDFDYLYWTKIGLLQNIYALIFIDLNMPNALKIEICDPHGNPQLNVIFMADTVESGIKAIDKRPFEYMLKPITKSTVLQALEKFKDFKIHSLIPIKEAKSQDQNSIPSSIILSSNNGFERINLEMIIKIEASKSYSIFYMIDSQKRVSTKNLGYFERLLPQESFIRVHHHCIINTVHIKSYHPSGHY